MANTSYQSKSKNTPTGQLPKQVRDKMEEARLAIINRAKVEKARKEDAAAGSTPLRSMGTKLKPGTKPDRDRKAQANRAKSQGGRSFEQAGVKKKSKADTMSAAAKTKRDIIASMNSGQKPAAKKPSAKTGTTTTAPKKPSGKTWKDYSSIAAAKAAGSLYYNKGGKKMAAVTKSDLDKSGLSLRDYMNYKTGKTRKAAPKKAATKKTGMSTGNTVAGVKSTKKPTTNSKAKARDLTLRDKGGISARRNTKGPLAKARKEYPVTGPGSQSKILRNKKAK